MKRISFLAACTTFLFVVAGCGGGNVDESLLPTRIPTLSPADLVVTAASVEPVATATSQPAPTEEPATAESEAPADAPQVEPTAQDSTAAPAAETAPQESATPLETPSSDETPAAEEASTSDEAPADAETTAPEEEATAETAADSTEEMTDTVTLAEPAAEADDDAGAISASEEVTGTDEVQLEEEPATNGQEITSTLEITETEASDSDAGTTVTEEITDTAPSGTVLPTPTPDATAGEQPETDEATDQTAPDSDTTTPEPGAETESDTGDAEEEAGPVDLSLPENIAQALADADVDNGESLTLSNACIGCHSLDPDQPMPGPTWSNIAITAATRVEGQDADAYLYHSIANPNQYVVEGFQPNVMLQIYRDTLSEQAMADIIAYLLTLEGRN